MSAFHCHACGAIWHDDAAHRAACPQFANYAAWLERKPAPSSSFLAKLQKTPAMPGRKWVEPVPMTATQRDPDAFSKPIEQHEEPLYARWWPLGRSDEGRYADGTILHGVLTIEHIGSPWSSVHGFVTDRVDVGAKGGSLAFIDRPAPIDPLDVEYEGLTLRELLVIDEVNHMEWTTKPGRLTPAQRAAVSAHWSAELRAKVAASTAADKARETSVVVDMEDW